MRIVRDNTITDTIVLAAGASDADNLVDSTVPSDNCTLVNVLVTQKTAGTGTGTFSIQLKYGESSPTAIGSASSATFIDADAVAGTIHGTYTVNTNVRNSAGKHLNISTVKTGSVTGNATCIYRVTWQV